MMEKLQGFATESKYVYDVTGQDILNDYQHRRGDVWERVDALTINKRVASTGKGNHASPLSANLMLHVLRDSNEDGAKAEHGRKRPFESHYKCLNCIRSIRGIRVLWI
jgi:hypothetical protein